MTFDQGRKYLVRYRAYQQERRFMLFTQLAFILWNVFIIVYLSLTGEAIPHMGMVTFPMCGLVWCAALFSADHYHNFPHYEFKRPRILVT